MTINNGKISLAHKPMSSPSCSTPRHPSPKTSSSMRKIEPLNTMEKIKKTVSCWDPLPSSTTLNLVSLSRL